MIQGTQLRDAIVVAAARLTESKDFVDELNIFPVPDGDTGTNMSMTINAAAREVARLADGVTVGEVAEVTASAMLRGARGNSGVILSLLFRGFAKSLKDRNEADGADLARALTTGVEAAYKAVMKPTEGTILTVAREAAEDATALVETESDALTVWERICDRAEESLANTPNLLPVLKKAGVVDSGGQGLCIIFRAMQKSFAGEEVADAVGIAPAAAPSGAARASAAGSFEADIHFTYCTEFIVGRDKACGLDPAALRATLEAMGDCVVVVDDEEIIKVHVHTNDPGKALQEGMKYGAFETVKVENMRIQHQNAGWVDGAETAPEQPEEEPAEATEPFGFVAVAAGEGLAELFRELGCAQVVSGGQTMNPSTEDILTAVRQTPAKVVYVFPNNKNIILAAEQAAALSDRELYVVPTKSIPQGMSALMAFDPDATVEANRIAMRRAAETVADGALTYAVRDSEYGGYSIKAGAILGMERGKLTFTDTNLEHAAVKLTKSLINDRKLSVKKPGMVTLMYGKDVTMEDADALYAKLSDRFGDVADITMVSGGQAVYYYYIAVE